MNISQAIDHAREGKKIAREGWNGKGMFLVMGGGYTTRRENVRMEAIGEEFLTGQDVEALVIHPHLDMWTAQKTLLVGWTPNQHDLFATDWVVVE